MASQPVQTRDITRTDIQLSQQASGLTRIGDGFPMSASAAGVGQLPVVYIKDKEVWADSSSVPVNSGGGVRKGALLPKDLPGVRAPP